jgi:hypothetical protein
MFRPAGDLPPEETVPLRRSLFWIVVWLVILAGIVLFFRYARELTPLLD